MILRRYSQNPARKKEGVNNAEKLGRSVWLGRVLFIASLFITVGLVGLISMRFWWKAERSMTRDHFHAISKQALAQVAQSFLAKRWSTITMASMIAELRPNISEWPFVNVPGYEKLAGNLVNTTNSKGMSLIVFVKPSQVKSWEDHAYNFYYNVAQYPQGTATSSFGKGIWAMNATTPTEDHRYHDNGDNFGGGKHAILAPVFQTDQGGQPMLLYNIYSSPPARKAVDEIIDCVETETLNNEKIDTKCGAVVPILDTIQSVTNVPTSPIFQPIRPVNSPSNVSANANKRSGSV